MYVQQNTRETSSIKFMIEAFVILCYFTHKLTQKRNMLPIFWSALCTGVENGIIVQQFDIHLIILSEIHKLCHV